jgi:hypothetical protein
MAAYTPTRSSKKWPAVSSWKNQPGIQGAAMKLDSKTKGGLILMGFLAAMFGVAYLPADSWLTPILWMVLGVMAYKFFFERNKGEGL